MAIGNVVDNDHAIPVPPPVPENVEVANNVILGVPADLDVSLV
jgi:hypothetical protein